jgi:hypothetical protein
MRFQYSLPRACARLDSMRERNTLGFSTTLFEKRCNWGKSPSNIAPIQDMVADINDKGATENQVREASKRSWGESHCQSNGNILMYGYH